MLVLKKLFHLNVPLVDGERYYSDLTWGTAETKPTSNYDKLLNQPVVPPAVSKSSAPGLPLPVSPLSSAGEWSGSCDSRTPLLSTACRVADLGRVIHRWDELLNS